MMGKSVGMTRRIVALINTDESEGSGTMESQNY